MQLPASVGKYELIEFLGGGMSHVYRARDTVIDRPVVVKILTDDGCRDPEAKARFLQEARLAGNIQHDNIVSVFDFGEHDGHPFIVMEYLKGEDLRDAIKNGHTGSLYQRIKIALQIAEALEYVNGRGIIHRDIKPENIHIDPNGRVKLMDFGIAKTADLSLTRTGMAMGTPYYMAPEQVAGRLVTLLVDVYAFGMLFYELLTGVRGVNGDTIEQVLFQILNQPLDLAPMENAGVPPAVRELVTRCVAKKAEARPHDFHVIANELQGLLAAAGSKTRVVTQVAASAPDKSSTRALAIGAGLALLIVVLAGGAWWLLRPPKPITSPPITPVEISGMLYVPAGTFLSGADKKPTKLQAFYIDETEVSNAQFADFCRANSCEAPAGRADLPVVRITVAQARAYAKWKGKRLPSALEWERAARGTIGARYPWGDSEDSTLANLKDNSSLAKHELMPVRSFAGYPPYQMAGNAWEMLDGPVKPSAAALSKFSTLLTPAPTADEPWIEIRGGSYNTPLLAAVAYEFIAIPERYSAVDIGFRCAKDP